MWIELPLPLRSAIITSVSTNYPAPNLNFTVIIPFFKDLNKPDFQIAAYLINSRTQELIENSFMFQQIYLVDLNINNHFWK